MNKKRKIIIISVASFVLVFCLLLGFAAYRVYNFKYPKIQNVFEQLYYEVRAVKYGGDSVLVTGTEEAYADYDFGDFENIQIPELDLCLKISRYPESETLYIMFFDSKVDRESDDYFVMYKYDMTEKTLYGKKDLQYLSKNFLSHYFGWCEENEYSVDDLGDFKFELREEVHFN
ncbi:MAG: hypothetical protein IJO64_06990 [Clostridia bacterium]|nr:hypothetical protein [Clostridia bacterium]